MGVIKNKKDENQKMLIIKSSLKKYLWDLPYDVRVEVGNLIALIDQTVIANRNIISSYLEKEKRKQLTIYDFND